MSAIALLRDTRRPLEERARAAAPRLAYVPAEPGMALDLSGLGKAFGPKQVLTGIDLSIPAGQFVAVVGKSGCGKSTLLRLLVGLDRPSEGEIHFGTEPRAQKAARLMFQEPRLLPWERVIGNVEVGIDRAVPPPERRRQAIAALREVGLEDRAGEWPAVLSGGMKQRVALARALVGRPRLLALDEPLGALDALTRIEMQALVERVWQSQGFTALLVTHDVTEAVALADRIVVLDSGRVALDLGVDIPRPRRRGDERLAAIEGRILDTLLGAPAP